jgi:hypothetical protein
MIIIRPNATSSITTIMVTDNNMVPSSALKGNVSINYSAFHTAYAITWIVQIQFVHANENGILPFFLLIVSQGTEKPISACSSEADGSNSFIRYIVSFTTCPQPLPKKFSTVCDQVSLPSSAFSFIDL